MSTKHTHGDLVKRLLMAWGAGDVRFEAADRIEELEREAKENLDAWLANECRQALGAARAQRGIALDVIEAAANEADAWDYPELAKDIRAIDVDAIIKGVK